MRDDLSNGSALFKSHRPARNRLSEHGMPFNLDVADVDERPDLGAFFQGDFSWAGVGRSPRGSICSKDSCSTADSERVAGPNSSFAETVTVGKHKVECDACRTGRPFGRQRFCRGAQLFPLGRMAATCDCSIGWAIPLLLSPQTHFMFPSRARLALAVPRLFAIPSRPRVRLRVSIWVAPSSIRRVSLSRWSAT